jgi:hypothetical protein
MATVGTFHGGVSLPSLILPGRRPAGLGQGTLGVGHRQRVEEAQDAGHDAGLAVDRPRGVVGVGTVMGFSGAAFRNTNWRPMVTRSRR